MRISFFLFLLAICLTDCSTARKSSSKVNNIEPQLQAVLDSIYQAHPTAVGIMAHVEAPNQKISWSGAVGLSDQQKQTPLQADQPVLIASNTKTYVAATVLRLVEQKKLHLNQPISELLTTSTQSLLQQDNYDLEKIKLVHLLSHTSGIFDYVNAPEFFERLQKDPVYRWTREEQVALAISSGEPLAPPGDHFSYADTNYSLLSEIIEEATGQKFYTAIRNLLSYQQHGLDATWFITLEQEPKGLKKRAHQYVGEMNIDVMNISPSFDLFGGGGIAATSRDLARFSQLLFEKKLFDNPETLDLIYTEIKTKDEASANYYLGLSKDIINGKTAYGHGGFWGTVVMYIPDLNTSIAVFILERDQGKLRKAVLESLVNKL